MKINILLFTVGTLLCNNSFTQTIRFNPSEKKLNTNIGSPFKSGNNLSITIATAELDTYYAKMIEETQNIWLAKAEATRKKITKEEAYRKFLIEYLSLDYNDYTRELEAWRRYLKEKTYENSCPSFTYFPCLPTKTEFVTRANKLFQIKLKGNPESKNLDAKYLLNDNSPLIIKDGNTHIQLDILYKDLIKECLVNYYNNSLSMTNVADIDPDDLQKWSKDLGADVTKASTELITGLSNIINYADISCEPAKIFFDKAKTFDRCLFEIINSSPLTETIKKNKEFFKKWLWYNDGNLSFNPFSFTTEDNYRTTIEPDTEKAKIFDSLIALKLGCDICKTSVDSLEYILRQQKTGLKRFSNESDIEKQKAINKLAYEGFLKGSKLLYNFSYPYCLNDESEPVVHEYDAANNFARVDYKSYLQRRIFVKNADIEINRKKLIKVNNNINIENTPVVAVYNVPKGSEILFSSANKDSALVSKASQNIGELAGDVAAAAALLSPLSGTMNGILALINTSSNLRSNGIIPANGLPPETILGKEVKGNNVKSNFFDNKDSVLMIPINPTTSTFTSLKKLQSVTVLDTTFLYDIGCEYCGTNIKELILKFIAKRYNIACPYHFIQELIKEDGSCCKSKDPYITECCFKNLIEKFITGINEKIKEINTQRDACLHSIKTILTNSASNQILGISNLQVPPPSISLNFALFDTSSHYAATKLFYPTHADEGKKSVRNDYTIKGSKLPYDTTIAGHFNMKKKQWYSLGAGFLGTINNLPVTKVSSSEPLTFARDDNAWRFTAGIHIYPFGMLDIDNRFIIHRRYGESSWSRLSIYLGVGIPKPLENFYSGLSVDLVPGLRVHSGVRWAWDTRYEILNSQIVNQASSLKYGGYYVGLNIDPASIVKILGIF